MFGQIKLGPNPSRIHKTTNNMIHYKNLMFICSFLLNFSRRHCRSKNDHVRLSHRISFMNTCSPNASVSANLSKICTFLWLISVAIKCSASVSAPISSSVLNNVSLKNLLGSMVNPKNESHVFVLFDVKLLLSLFGFWGEDSLLSYGSQSAQDPIDC